MNSDWGFYETYLKAIQTVSGATASKDQAVDSFIESMSEDPGYQKDSTVNGVVTPILANPKDALVCELRAAPGTNLHIGDMVHVYEEDWIIAELYTDKVGIINGEMWVCNDTLRFQNHTPEICVHKCVVDDGRFTKRSIDPLVYIPVNTYVIYLSIDPETAKLHIDKRLGLGNVWTADNGEVMAVYKIIGIDNKSKNHATGDHMMILTVQKDVYHAEKDSMELGICDVIKSYSEDTPLPGTGVCSVTGKDAIRIGTTRKYTAVFTASDGTTLSDVATKWNIDAPDVVSYKINGAQITVTVPLKEDLVGQSITLTANSADGDFSDGKKKVGVIAIG